MLNRILLAIGIGLVIASVLISLEAIPCLAGWCPTHKCYGPSNCLDCVCMSRDFSGGVCVSLEAVPSYREQGFRVVE